MNLSRTRRGAIVLATLTLAGVVLAQHPATAGPIIQVQGQGQGVFENEKDLENKWTITSKTDDKVTITAIKDFRFAFDRGEGDDAVISHEAKTLPKLPFTFKAKGSMLNFKTKYSTEDIILDGDTDIGLWQLSVTVDFMDETTGKAGSETGMAPITVNDRAPNQVPAPASLTLGLLGVLSLMAKVGITGIWRRGDRR
jgi:hypothetical protein